MKKTYECEWCGKPVIDWASNKRFKHIFCNLSCRGKYFWTKNNPAKTSRVKEILRRQKLGEKNPQYGKPAWNSGKKGVQTAWNKGMKMPRIRSWVGLKSDYDKLHKWVINKLGQPDRCSECGSSGLSGKQIHWANKSGKYLKRVKDWIRLCAKCHTSYDLGKKELLCVQR